MSTGNAPSPMMIRITELTGRSALLLLSVIVLAGYRLYSHGTPKDQFPHSLALLIGGIASLLLITAYGNLVGSAAKPSWANAMFAFGGLVPYAYCLYVIAFLGVWPLVQLFTEPKEGSVLLGIFGVVAGYGTLKAFWQITELGNSSVETVSKPSQPDAPLSQAQVARLTTVLDCYGALIEQEGPSGEIVDQTALPYPKDEIKVALCLALSSPNLAEEDRAAYCMCLVLLAQYQPGVGPEPLWPHGLNQRRIPKTNAGNSLSPQQILAGVLAASNEENGRRYELFRPKVEAERQALLKLTQTIKPGHFGARA